LFEREARCDRLLEAELDHLPRNSTRQPYESTLKIRVAA
jgi:hypothetical protein